MFENTEVSLYDDGKCAVISKGMDQIQVASGNRAVVFNETLRDMPTTLYLNGEAYVPVCWISELLNGTKATVGYNACYINKDGGEMSFDFAFIIKKILGMEYDRSNLERVELEESLKKKGDKQYAAHNVAGDIYGGKSEEIFQKLKEKYEADYAEYVKAQ